MANIKVFLTNYSGSQLARFGYNGTANVSPPPPNFMTNGLTYGPIYMSTGTVFHVAMGYKMSSNLRLGVGNDNFEVTLRSQNAVLEVRLDAIPANHTISYETDETPEGYEVRVTYQ